MKLFLTDSVPSCNFAYSATVKPRPSADYIGMKISILPPIQLVFNVIELAVLQRILYNTILQNNFLIPCSLFAEKHYIIPLSLISTDYVLWDQPYIKG